jgi:hypothetical protein
MFGHDEVVGTSIHAEAEREPVTGDAVDAGELLGQQRRGPRGCEQEPGQQADAVGRACGGGQGDCVGHTRVGACRPIVPSVANPAFPPAPPTEG